MNSKTPPVNSIGALSASSWRHRGLVLVCVALLACAGKSAGSSADATPGGDTAGSLADDAGASGSDSGAVGDTAGSDPVDVAGGDSADDDVVLAKDLPCVDLAKVKPGTPCDDGDPCTSVDQCHGGKCRGVVDTCMDGDVCTEDKCDKGTCTFVVVNDSLGCGKSDVPNPVPEVGEWPAEAVPARGVPHHMLRLHDGSLLVMFQCHAARTSPTWKWLWTFDLPKFLGYPGQGTTKDPASGYSNCDTSGADGSPPTYDPVWIADAAETADGGFLLLGHGDGTTETTKPLWYQSACKDDCLVTWVLPVSATGQPLGDRRPLRRSKGVWMSWKTSPFPSHLGAITRVDRNRYVALYPKADDDPDIQLTILRASGEVVASRTLGLPAGLEPSMEFPDVVMWGQPGGGGTVTWSVSPTGLVVQTGPDGSLANTFDPGPGLSIAYAMSDGRIVVRRPIEGSEPAKLLPGGSKAIGGGFGGMQRQVTIAPDWTSQKQEITFAPYAWSSGLIELNLYPNHRRRWRIAHDPVLKIDLTPTRFKMGSTPESYFPETGGTPSAWIYSRSEFLRMDRLLFTDPGWPVGVKSPCLGPQDPPIPQCEIQVDACHRVLSSGICPECGKLPVNDVPCGPDNAGACQAGKCVLPTQGTP